MGSYNTFTNPQMFRDLHAKHGPDWRAGGYQSKLSQHAAFQQLRTGIYSCYEKGSELSLLDVGGGCGDIIPWLKSNGITVTAYGHVEAVQELQEHVKNAYGALVQESTADLAEIRGTYDLVICIGLLSHWEGTLSELKRYYEHLVDLMDVRAIKGVAINCPSPYSDWLPREKKALPLDYVTEVLKRKSERVILNLDECPHLLLGSYWKGLTEWRKQWHTDRMDRLR